MQWSLGFRCHIHTMHGKVAASGQGIGKALMTKCRKYRASVCLGTERRMLMKQRIQGRIKGKSAFQDRTFWEKNQNDWVLCLNNWKRNNMLEHTAVIEMTKFLLLEPLEHENYKKRCIILLNDSFPENVWWSKIIAESAKFFFFKRSKVDMMSTFEFILV